VRSGQIVVLASALTSCGRVHFAQLDDASVPIDALACETPSEVQHTSEGTAHSDGGVPTVWQSNPPTSGIHFDRWVRWNHTYLDRVIPRAYWVHNLEHGGIVFGVHCETPCPDELTRITAMLAALPNDAECTALGHRAIVVLDPELPAGVRFSASAWLHSWTSNCLDEASLTAFYKAHFAQGPETNCTDGDVP